MRRLAVCGLLIVLVACFGPQVTGYDAADPTRLVCPCDDGDTCYESAAKLAEQQGETAETGEPLLEYAQCACLEGSYAGCNTLGHFAKDWVDLCNASQDVAKACTMTGFIYEHAVRLPAGKSVHRDAALSKAAFAKACQAGSTVACRQTAH